MKSSLELALERAQNLEFAESITDIDQYYRQGQQLAGKLYNQGLQEFTHAWESINLDSTLSEHIMKGVIKSMLANLVLPQQDDQLTRAVLTLQAIEVLNPDYQELERKGFLDFLESYRKQYPQFIIQLKEQLASHLQQKEQALLAKTGRQQHLSLQNDPETATIYADEVKKFQLYFSDHLHQHKWQLLQKLGFNPGEFSF
ncbi:hypothetical protein PVA45_00180 [Entomospira entomophila]|uniref:Uncharacterized protein n=1 Tax=Entomospira entomophila TaxID=2719988 RepID=A0A968G8T8_9SPIO|nr:DUF6657 family protein [Entomospira entomophilus]NIZ39940.1 hypothetical protein [Entomospira entomophilus]WDI35501.1 hypothetical protein PVA45_00180 [Entomospira entomophilus]